VTVDGLEKLSVLSFLDSLRPPVHVILLYRNPSELDDVASKIKVSKGSRTAPRYATERAHDGSLTPEGTFDRWVVNRVEQGTLSNPAKLIEMEEKIREMRRPRMALCVYPLRQIVELDMSIFVDILSLHDYVLLPGFAEGQKVMLEAVEEALESTLGRSGSEMIYRFAYQTGIRREQIPCELRRFRHVLRELLGIGADFLERFIFRRLYLKLESSPQVACVDGG